MKLENAGRSAVTSALLAVVVGPVVSCARHAGEAAEPPPAPPEARREAVTQSLHGTEVADPYRWLEEVEGVEALEWARAQDAYARAFLRSDGKRLARIRERLAANASSGDMNVPLEDKTNKKNFLALALAEHNP